jgi:uncharacterized protein with gpF-like domain
MMTKQQIQIWVGLNCKFAMDDKVEKFSTAIVSQITKASKEISGNQFSNIVMAVLMKIAIVPIPAPMQETIKTILRNKIKGKEKYSGPQMQQLMQQILLGTDVEPGIVRQFNFDINSPVLQNIMNGIIGEMHERKGPADRPQGDYGERKRQEGQEAQQYMGKGGPKIHFSPPRR